MDYRNEAVHVASQYLCEKYGLYYNKKDCIKYVRDLFHITNDGFFDITDYYVIVHVTPPRRNDLYIKVKYDCKKHLFSVSEYAKRDSITLEKSEHEIWMNS